MHTKTKKYIKIKHNKVQEIQILKLLGMNFKMIGNMLNKLNNKREYQQLTGNSTKESSGDLACTQPEPSVLHALASSEMASSKMCCAPMEWTWAEQTGADRR